MRVFRLAFIRVNGSLKTRRYLNQSVSEAEFRSHLHLARTLRAEDASEVGGAEDAVRQVECGRVERVEALPPQLELTRPQQCPRFRDDEIEIRESWSDDAVPRRAAERVKRGQRECRRLEPLLAYALVGVNVRVALLIRRYSGPAPDCGLNDPKVHVKRCTRLREEHGVHAPPGKHS